MFIRQFNWTRTETIRMCFLDFLNSKTFFKYFLLFEPNMNIDSNGYLDISQLPQRSVLMVCSLNQLDVLLEKKMFFEFSDFNKFFQHFLYLRIQNDISARIVFGLMKSSISKRLIQKTT